MADRRCSQYAGPLDVRAAEGPTRKGRAGKWLDAASAEHGDLLDVIQESCGLVDFRDVAEEAKALPRLAASGAQRNREPRREKALSGSSEAARRLWDMSRPVAGTLADIYLRQRRIIAFHDITSLRFHPRCYCRTDDHRPTKTWPAMIAAVTDLAGGITGAHRTWLSPDGSDKAPIETQRKAMGDLLATPCVSVVRPKSWRWAKASKPCSP